MAGPGAHLERKTTAVVGDFAHPYVAAGTSLASVLTGLGHEYPSLERAAPSINDASLTSEIETAALSDWRSVSRTINGSDGVVVVNPVLGPSTRALTRLARLTARARLHGRPVALVGLSVWGETSPIKRRLIRSIIRNSDLALLSDEQSADALSDIGVEPPFRMGADPAWAQLDALFAARRPADRVVVALDTAPLSVDERRYEDHLVAVLRRVSTAGLGVTLQPWDSSTGHAPNVATAHAIASSLDENVEVLHAPATLREARDVYASSRVVLALCPQALMAAACAGSRAVAMGSDPSIDRLSSSLGLRTISPSDSPDAAARAILATADGSPANAVAVRQHIDRAKGSIELVKLLLSGGEGIEPSTIDPLPLYPIPWRP